MKEKTIIIAECGINHNGDLNIAKRLIDVAKDAGCDAVKFQKRDIDTVYTQEYLDGPRESRWGKTQRDQKQGLEFGKNDYDEIDSYCKRIGIEWFASPWDLKSLEFLKQYDLKYNKVASALLCHRELMEAMASEKKYTFISTGMSTMEEIDATVDIFKAHDCPFELMHCNSQYPMPDEVANLNVIDFLSERYRCEVGYSGHSTGIIESVAAVALGASSIEKHITLDRSMKGSDQSSSLEPTGIRKTVEYIRTVERMAGDGIKRISDAENSCKSKLQRTTDN